MPTCLGEIALLIFSPLVGVQVPALKSGPEQLDSAFVAGARGTKDLPLVLLNSRGLPLGFSIQE